MSPTTAPQRPAKVTLALKLLYASVAIGVIRKIMLGIRHADVRSPDFLIAVSLVLLAVSLVLIHQTGRGKNWARWSMVGVLVLSLPLSILPMLQAIHHTPLPNLLGLVQVALFVVSLVLLFHASSSSWFRANPDSS